MAGEVPFALLGAGVGLAPPSLRQVIALAKHPFTALGPRACPIEHRWRAGAQGFDLHVRALDEAIGIATVADEDVLLVCAGFLAACLNAGVCPLPRTVQVTNALLLRALGRPMGGRQVRLLAGSIARLANSEVTTNVGPASTKGPQQFRLLEGVTPPTKPGESWALTLPDWFVRQVATGHMRKVDLAEVKMRGLLRRLFGWARAYAGPNGSEEWRMSLRDAYAKSAARGAYKTFKHDVSALHDRLPQYTLAIEKSAAGRDTLVIRRLNPMTIGRAAIRVGNVTRIR